jgi:DNA-binding CsgD family transcriptional regulator/PAS domain-containing protein
MRHANQSAAIRPARRLAFRIAAAVMLVQAAVFSTAGFFYLLWFENNLDTDATNRVLAPGRLIQSGQLPHAAFSDRTKMHDIVGNGLADALLVGINGNVFHALEPSRLGKDVGSLPDIDPAWFRGAGSEPKLIHFGADGRSYIVGITPLITFDNIAPFLYTYVKLDATVIKTEKEQMRAAAVAAVLFRRIKSALRVLGKESEDAGSLAQAPPANDEMELVELGLQRFAEDRRRERSLRAEAETALIEVQAKEAASASAAMQAETRARRVQSLIDSVPGGLITIDPQSRILTCNDTAARRLGTPSESAVGQPLQMFLRPVADGAPAADGRAASDAQAWPSVGTHRVICDSGDGGELEIEIVVGHGDDPEPHRVVLLQQSGDADVRQELELLSESIGQAFRLTSGQWRSVGERLAMLREYFSGLEAERRMVSDALDRVPLAVAVVDCKGTVRYVNRLGESVLDMKDGLLVLQGRLTAARSGDNGRLRERILEVARGSVTGSGLPWAAMRVERENGTAWLIRIAPLGPVDQRQPSMHGMVIVMISDPHMPMKPSTTMLRQLHGLTYAEADIMGRLTVGMRISEIASDLDISVETVRTHLKAIFTKTGTSRQADLVRHAVLSGAVLHEQEFAQDASPADAERPLLGPDASSPVKRRTSP